MLKIKAMRKLFAEAKFAKAKACYIGMRPAGGRAADVRKRFGRLL